MTSSSRSLALRLLAAAALTAAAIPALAADGDARTFFAQGRRLRAEGKCAEAIVAFRRALDLYPQGLGSIRNIAECEEQLGQYASARNDWWSLRRAVLQSNEPRYDGWDRDAERAYARLEPRVGRLTVALRGESLGRVRLVIDGKPLDPRLVGVELERDLGPHVIEAFYGGAAPIRRSVDLASGQRATVTLDIPAAPAEPAPGPRRSAQPDAGGHGGARTAGIVALAPGGAGLAGAVAAAVVRGDALSRIDGACPTRKGCPEDVRADEDTGRTATTLANVFGVVAIVGVGAGVPLLLLGGSSGGGQRAAPGNAPRLDVGLAPLGGGAAARVGGRF
ncbi:MAG: tetratricopeptide repeat protein [Polyangiaceae bacterium]|nr:tetratricopeptide repeat protein [Polyangiaceae bacterium]